MHARELQSIVQEVYTEGYMIGENHALRLQREKTRKALQDKLKDMHGFCIFAGS